MFQSIAINKYSKTMPSGYSGAPLEKKLGLKSDFLCLLCNVPSHYFELFDNFPGEVIKFDSKSSDQVDFIHLFCTTELELKTYVTKYKPALKNTGLLWVSWPKGTSKIKTDLKREPIRDYLLSTGLVDVKVAAIDEDWSGLKFVYRLKDRI